MKPTAYLETTIISYLAARLSRDLITAARQQVTHDWWHRRRADFDLFVSELVPAECAAGDAEAALRRATWVTGIPVIDLTPLAESLARDLAKAARLPATAQADALQIALAATSGIDYLRTWTSAHIANAVFRPRVERACRAEGYEPPVLCTPDELLEG